MTYSTSADMRARTVQSSTCLPDDIKILSNSGHCPLYLVSLWRCKLKCQRSLSRIRPLNIIKHQKFKNCAKKTHRKDYKIYDKFCIYKMYPVTRALQIIDGINTMWKKNVYEVICRPARSFSYWKTPAISEI